MYKQGTKAKHNIDLVFLVVLFLVFTFSALSVLFMEVNCYRGVVNSSEENSSIRVATGYIREVIHQYDEAGRIELVEFDGVKTLKINEADDYYIYIYFYNGALMELNAKSDFGGSLDAGEKIIELESMEMTCNESILEVMLKDNNFEETIVVSLKTKGVSDER